DMARDEVSLRDLNRDLVAAGTRDAKDLRRLLHSLAVKAHAGQRGIVRDEVLGDVVVKDAPIARPVVIDHLNVASDQILVLGVLHAYHPPPTDRCVSGEGISATGRARSPRYLLRPASAGVECEETAG